MNATQTLIMDFLTSSNSYHSVKEIQAAIGKGETTIRENLKVLLESGDVSKDGKLYTDTPIVPDEPVTVEEAKAESFATDDSEVADELDRLGVEIAAEASVQRAVVDSPAAPIETADAASEDAPAKKKKYRRHDTPTTRTIRVNQITGFQIQVLRGDEFMPEAPPAKWVTICLEHDTVGESDRVLDAHFASTYPEFCPECDKKLNPADGPSLVGRRRHPKA